MEDMAADLWNSPQHDVVDVYLETRGGSMRGGRVCGVLYGTHRQLPTCLMPQAFFQVTPDSDIIHLVAPEGQ